MAERTDFDLVGIPESYGTNNCFDCGAEPMGSQPFWQRFVFFQGKEYSVPQCDICLAEMMAKNQNARAADLQPPDESN